MFKQLINFFRTHLTKQVSNYTDTYSLDQLTEIETIIREAITAAKSNGCKIINKQFGVEKQWDQDHKWVIRNTLWPACCPMGAVLLHKQPHSQDPNYIDFGITDSLVKIMGISGAFFNGFITGFDSPDRTGTGAHRMVSQFQQGYEMGSRFHKEFIADSSTYNRDWVK